MPEETDNNQPGEAPAAEAPPENAGQDDRPESKAKKRPGWLILLLIILLILLLLFFGWLWWKDKDQKEPAGGKKDSTSRSDGGAAEPACADGLADYQNTGLGLGFCYPAAWGDVTVNDAKFEAADAGSRWRLSFTAKEMVNLGVVSADWSTDVPRDGTCVDPAVQTLPAFAPFSTDWITTLDLPVSGGSRGIEVSAGEYLIVEEVDSLLTSGVCLRGYTVIDSVYPHTAASYSAEFAGAIMDPEQHIASPTTLISAADRTDFTAFVKSVRKVE